MILTAGLCPPELNPNRKKKVTPTGPPKVVKVHARKRPIMFDLPTKEHMRYTEEQKKGIPKTIVNLHKKLMSSCYGYKDSAYYQKTDNGRFVVKQWWDLREFFKDIQKLPNYDAYVAKPCGFSCTTKIYDANYVGPDTICIVSCGSMTVYAANRAMKVEVDGVTHTCITIDDVVRVIGVPRATIAHARMKVGEFDEFTTRGFLITQHSGRYRYAIDEIKTVSDM